jgi:hypothetical protein
MARPYIPNSDAEFNAFAGNFAAKIAAAPADYGLLPADAAGLSAAVASWGSAFLAASSPSTRTRGAVMTKDEQRRAAEGIIRGLASRIRVNDAIPEGLKAGLGVRPVPRSYARVATPHGAPVISVTEVGAARHTLLARDRDHLNGEAEDGGSASRPKGAIGLLLFRVVADAPAAQPDRAEFLGFITRGKAQSLFTTADRGKTATYFARWTNAKGQMGPWSVPTSMAIAA